MGKFPHSLLLLFLRSFFLKLLRRGGTLAGGKEHNCAYTKKKGYSGSSQQYEFKSTSFNPASGMRAKVRIP